MLLLTLCGQSIAICGPPKVVPRVMSKLQSKVLNAQALPRVPNKLSLVLVLILISEGQLGLTTQLLTHARLNGLNFLGGPANLVHALGATLYS